MMDVAGDRESRWWAGLIRVDLYAQDFLQESIALGTAPTQQGFEAT